MRRSANQNPNTGLPNLPDGEVWWVRKDGSYYVISVTKPDENGQLTAPYEDRLLADFNGAAISDLADVSQMAIRDAANRVIKARTDAVELEKRRAANQSLLGLYPPNTLEPK